MPTITRNTALPVRIRPATLADTPAIYAIEQQSFNTDGFNKRQFKHAVSKGQNLFLVATQGPEIAGYILVLLHKGRPHMGRIYSIAVNPAHQGKGIAALLLQTAVDALRKKRITTLRLEVRKDNTHATQFYTHKGFTAFASEPNYYADGMAALKMQLNLNEQAP